MNLFNKNWSLVNVNWVWKIIVHNNLFRQFFHFILFFLRSPIWKISIGVTYPTNKKGLALTCVLKSPVIYNQNRWNQRVGSLHEWLKRGFGSVEFTDDEYNWIFRAGLGSGRLTLFRRSMYVWRLARQLKIAKGELGTWRKRHLNTTWVTSGGSNPSAASRCPLPFATWTI